MGSSTVTSKRVREYSSIRIRHIPNSLSSTAGSSNQLNSLETREKGNWVEETFAKASGTVAGDRKKH